MLNTRIPRGEFILFPVGWRRSLGGEGRPVSCTEDVSGGESSSEGVWKIEVGSLRGAASVDETSCDGDLCGEGFGGEDVVEVDFCIGDRDV